MKRNQETDVPEGVWKRRSYALALHSPIPLDKNLNEDLIATKKRLPLALSSTVTNLPHRKYEKNVQNKKRFHVPTDNGNVNRGFVPSSLSSEVIHEQKDFSPYTSNENVDHLRSSRELHTSDNLSFIPESMNTVRENTHNNTSLSSLKYQAHNNNIPTDLVPLFLGPLKHSHNNEDSKQVKSSSLIAMNANSDLYTNEGASASTFFNSVSIDHLNSTQISPQKHSLPPPSHMLTHANSQSMPSLYLFENQTFIDEENRIIENNFETNNIASNSKSLEYLIRPDEVSCSKNKIVSTNKIVSNKSINTSEYSNLSVPYTVSSVPLSSQPSSFGESTVSLPDAINNCDVSKIGVENPGCQVDSSAGDLTRVSRENLSSNKPFTFNGSHGKSQYTSTNVKEHSTQLSSDENNFHILEPTVRISETSFTECNDISKDHFETKVYFTRFWILGLFSLIAFFQCIIWGTWGPILESAQEAFPSWTDGTIALFPSWGPITVVPFMVPFSWLNEKYGLRYGVLSVTVLMTVGSTLRCFSRDEQTFTILANVGAIINGVAGCLTLSLPAMVAATWFPPHERTTATAVGSLMSQLGGAGAYLEPLIVRSPQPDLNKEDILDDIMTLMYIHAAIAGGLFICTLIYFPPKPSLPPSCSSATQRLNYSASVKAIAKNGQLLLLVVTYIFSFGIPCVWIGVMNFSLSCMGIKQDESMWIAIVAVSVSGLAAFAVARFTDYIYGHLRVTIICLLVLASICFLWFLLLTFKVIPLSIEQVYISVAGGISFEYATVPLLVELAVEIGYPCPESIIGAVLTQLFNVISGAFLLLLLIPTDCYQWVNVVLVVCTSLTIIPLLFVKETHKRSSKDK